MTDMLALAPRRRGRPRRVRSHRCGIRMYRAEAKLPSDLALALEVGATRTTARGLGSRPPRHALRARSCCG